MHDKIVIAILNAAIPQSEYSDYTEFLEKYPALTITEKITYLDEAFKPPKIFLEKMAFFLNRSIGLNRPSMVQKMQFVVFLKTINDLRFNNPLLLNLKGEITNTWTHYGLNEPSTTAHNSSQAESIHATLIDLMPMEDFTILRPFIDNPLTGDIPKEFEEGVAVLIKELGENAQQPFCLSHEKDICILFMLNQAKFLKHIISLAPLPIHLEDLYHLWDIRLKLVKLCAIHQNGCRMLLQAEVSLLELAKLAKISVALFTLMLQNAAPLALLIQAKWLMMSELHSFSIQNPKFCKTYLENPQQLTLFKAANVPFSILIQGDANTNCSHTKEILGALAQRTQFEHLISHPKVAEITSPDFKNEMHAEAAFMSACICSEACRLAVKSPNKMHQLLDAGFEPLLLLAHTTNLSIILEHIQKVFDLLSAGIPLPVFINWLRKSLLFSEILNHDILLINLKTRGIDLMQFAALTDAYPQHALLILQSPNHPHSQWWIKQQLKNKTAKEPKPIQIVKGKYRIVFDLDHSTVSRLSNPDDKWTEEFNQKGLCVYIPTMGDFYIIHPAFIESLRWLHMHGIETGIFSAGSLRRNQPLAQDIYTKAFQNPIYIANPTIALLFSYEHMKGSSFKKLNHFVKPGENIQNTMLVDDDHGRCDPKQQENFIEICPATEETFKSVYQKNPSHEVLNTVDHLYCVLGAIAKSIKKAEKTGCTLTHAFNQILNPPAPNKTTPPTSNTSNTYSPTKLFQYETYFAKGLKKLQAINPKLRRTTPSSFFADDYTLHPK